MELIRRSKIAHFIALSTLMICLLAFKAKKEDHVKIEKQITAFVDKLQKHKFEEAARHIFPSYFDNNSRSGLIEHWEETYTDSTLNIKIIDFEIDNITGVIKKNDYKFAFIEYRIKTETVLKNEHKFEDFHKNQFDYFTRKYGKDQVIFNSETETYTINVLRKFICIKAPRLLDWKFIYNDKKQAKYIQEYVPKSVIKKYIGK